MSSQQHDLAAELFVEAMDLDTQSRARLLDERCGDNAGLRREVESLLAAHDGAADRLNTPAAAAFVRAVSGGPSGGADAGDENAGGPLPERIGEYRILGVLGEGGMGRVYLAEQDQPHRRVALKVIRAGAASRSVLVRFEREAAALARLQHPGIATVYQTGTAETGRGPQPFLAMELVEGLPLTRHVRERGLDIRQRLELIARVCDAVQHAHERGIVHRDLKPANVLVIDEPTVSGSGHGPSDSAHDWGVGRPKVLDFGVARLIDDHATVTAATHIGQLIGTLAYMSPEQVGGGAAALDARSDVYSLGVMLYEVLTGKLPIDARAMSAPEAVRAIREDDPPTLSSIDRMFRGDIETIVAKSLEKDPERRYQSAAELAADLRRHLAAQPIEAHPPSTFYQLAKFAQRNRGLVTGIGVAAAVLVLATIALAIVAGVALSQRNTARVAEGQADKERHKAKEEARTARRINSLLDEVLTKAHPSTSGGKQVTVAEVADDLEKRIGDVLNEEPEARAALQATLANLLVGQGKYDRAVEQAQASLKAREQLLGPEHKDTLVSTVLLGHCLQAAGRFDEAAVVLNPGLVTLRRVDPNDKKLMCGYLAVLSAVATGLDHPEEAARLCDELIALIGDDAELAAYRRDAQVRLVGILSTLGRPGEALALAEKVLPEVEAAHDQPRPDLVEALMVVGKARARTRDYVGGEKAMRRAMEVAAQVLGEGHPRWLGAADGVAGMLASQGKFDEAEPLARRVLEMREQSLGPDHPHTLSSLNNLGWLLARRAGRNEEAEPVLRKALEATERKTGPSSVSTLNVKNNLAGVLYMMERHDEALEMYRTLVPTADEILPPGSVERARYRYGLGRSLLRKGDLAQAERLLLECYEMIKDRPSERNMRRQSRELLVEVYEALGKPEEAGRWAPESPRGDNQQQ